MQIALNIQNGNQTLFDALAAFLKTQPNLKFKLQKSKTKRTINGFTPEFEAELLAELRETKEAYEKGKIKPCKSFEEYKKAMNDL